MKHKFVLRKDQKIKLESLSDIITITAKCRKIFITRNRKRIRTREQFLELKQLGLPVKPSN